MRLKLLAATAALAAGLVATSASAATVTLSATINGNDCSGYFTFGSGFDSCQVFAMANGAAVKISPVIAKYDGNTVEVNSAFPSFTGTEVTRTGSATGSWTYIMGSNDPGIRYWAAKGSNAFNLFWTVNASAQLAGGACATSLLSLGCLSEALVVTSGSYFTPNNNSGSPAGLSHLTFYDSVPPNVIPLPAAGWLLLAGLGGLAAIRRRRKAA